MAELAIQYADYAAWQRRWMSGEVLEKQAEYWKSALAGAPALLELPTDRARPAVQDYAGESIGIELDEGLTSKLKGLSRRHGTTLFMTLLAGWAALLGRLSGQEEVVIGTPVANRRRVEIEGLIGFFVNTLALRMDLRGGPTSGRVAGAGEGADAGGAADIRTSVRAGGGDGAAGAEPVAQAGVPGDVRLAERARRQARTARAEDRCRWAAQCRRRRFDLSLSMQEAGQRIAGGVEYATALFDRETIERWLRILAKAAGGDGGGGGCR